MNRIFILFLLISTTIFSQVKIGDNPSVINPNSILELESTNKALVLTRLSTIQMNAITPLQGAMVYNTNEKCMFVFEGVVWKSLCNSGISVTTSTTAPTTNNEGDFWIDNSSNRELVNIWDGSTWVPINNNPKSGVGTPSINSSLLPGDIYVDETTGLLYTYNGSVWINVSSTDTVTASNGLTKDTNGEIQLGGDLIKPTVITTDATNTLAIQGVEDATATEDVNILVVDNSTGVIKKRVFSDLFQEEVLLEVATSGQKQFDTPVTITDIKKVNVYRNGVRIDFTMVNSTSIEVEPEAACYAGDEIRIVQFY